jgi:hypothetical protein
MRPAAAEEKIKKTPAEKKDNVRGKNKEDARGG